MNGWNGTRQSLPGEREYVQFVVAGRHTFLYGVYAEHCFRSRRKTYLPQEVSIWRKLGDAPQEPPVQRTHPVRRYWSEQPMREA